MNLQNKKKTSAISAKLETFLKSACLLTVLLLFANCDREAYLRYYASVLDQFQASMGHSQGTNTPVFLNNLCDILFDMSECNTIKAGRELSRCVRLNYNRMDDPRALGVYNIANLAHQKEYFTFSGNIADCLVFDFSERSSVLRCLERQDIRHLLGTLQCY